MLRGFALEEEVVMIYWGVPPCQPLRLWYSSCFLLFSFPTLPGRTHLSSSDKRCQLHIASSFCIYNMNFNTHLRVALMGGEDGPRPTFKICCVSRFSLPQLNQGIATWASPHHFVSAFPCHSCLGCIRSRIVSAPPPLPPSSFIINFPSYLIERP